MLQLALASLRHRRSSFIATFVAVLLGSAIMIAAGGLMETGIRIGVPPERLAAAPIVVTGKQTYVVPKRDLKETKNLKTVAIAERQWLDPALAQRIEAVPGVTAAIGETSVPATVLRDGKPVVVGEQSLGHDWSSAVLGPFRLDDGAAPSQSGRVVLDSKTAELADIDAGDRVSIVANGATRSFVVSGIAEPAAETQQSVLFFAAADLASLGVHGGQYDAIGVTPAPGTDVDVLKKRLSQALEDTPTSVRTGDGRGLAEYPEAVGGRAQLIPLAAVFLGMAVFITLFVVASTLGLSVQQRQRELGLLRVIGATSRQVRRMVFWETLVITVVAAVLGCVPAVLLGPALFELVSRAGVISSAVSYHQGFLPYLIGTFVAVLSALVAGRVVGRRASRIPAGQALAEAVVQKRWVSFPRILFAVLFFAGGVVLIITTAVALRGPVASATAGPAVMCWAISLALLSPGLTKLLSRLLTGPVRATSGVAGYLASSNLRTRSVRMASVVTPIMLAVGIAVANFYTATTQSAAAEKWFADGLAADVTVSSSTGGFAPGVVDQVRQVPGVAAASQYVTSQGWIDKPFDGSHVENPWPFQGVDAQAAQQISGIRTTAGNLSDLSGETAAVPAKKAADIGVAIGDSLALRMGDHEAQNVRVVALFEAKPGYEYILLPATLLARHSTSGLPSQILVEAEPGADPDTVKEAVSEQIGTKVPCAVVGDRSALVSSAEGTKTQTWVNYLLVGLITSYTMISVVNTLVMATNARRQELGMQRLIGATRKQVMQMLTVEAVMISVIGIILGTAASIATLLPFSVVVLGQPCPAGPIWIYLAVAVGAIGLTLVATLLPAWRILDLRPAEAALAVS
jgi:putative ABC transport system permease protein